jgi:hypothetical protein
MEPTRQVIERMNEALKNSAALIQVAGNRAKLHGASTSATRICSATVDACSKDLMTYLQIHQAGQLNILTSSVPIDPEDMAVQIFIANHGGVAAINPKKNSSLNSRRKCKWMTT